MMCVIPFCGMPEVNNRYLPETNKKSNKINLKQTFSVYSFILQLIVIL